MPKYYCDYCKSYLTHDTMSVRKSHLSGKNHIRYYCSYYENKVKSQGQWKDEMEYTIDSSVLAKGAPGGPGGVEEEDEETILPPPPSSFYGLPNPPPSKLNNKEQMQRAIAIHRARNVYEI